MILHLAFLSSNFSLLCFIIFIYFIIWTKYSTYVQIFVAAQVTLEKPRDGSLGGCHLWGHTESDTTDVT